MFQIQTPRLILRDFITDDWSVVFEHLGAQQITDDCEISNQASARVMEKAGLREVRRWMEETEDGVITEYIRYAISHDQWFASQASAGQTGI